MNDMYRIIYTLPDQIVEAISIFQCAWSDITPSVNLGQNCRRILICGMGGSGISGDLLSVLYPDLEILVNKDYQIPEYIDDKSIAILISYSGNTEETLYNYKILKKRGIPMVLISSNGKLLKNKALLKIKIPPGFPPRGALGYLFTPLPLFLYRIGLIEKNPIFALSRLSIFLKKHAPFLDKKGRDLAVKIFKKFPIIYADSPAFFVVARRWQCQLNENAKILSHINTIPEMNHNEIVGLGRPWCKDGIVFFLNDPNAFLRNRIRVKIIKEIISREIKGLKYYDITPEGRNLLEQIFWAIMLGDFLSYHLARLMKIDPLPVTRIDYLKKRLSLL
ncbi:MAG: bifunctional phosphoglucose/phosphomannose isomerase [candidate division WOR-3 bacterium]